MHFTALDFETTGLNASSDDIIEVGAVHFLSGNVVDTFEQLISINRALSEEVQKIHSISDDMLQNQPPIESVLPRLLAFIGDSVIVAHNALFDMGFLNAATNKCGIERVRNRVVDTVSLARRAFPGRVSYRLESLANDLALEYTHSRAHRGLHDATICMLLFERCVKELGFMGHLTLSELIS